MLVSLFFIVLSTLSIVLSTLTQFDSEPFVKIFDIIEYLCIVWFTLEILIRFLLSSHKSAFFKSALNIIDIVSIVPFLISKILSITQYFSFASNCIMFFKMLRILSVLKFARHSVGLHSLGYTFRKCFKELEPYIELFFIAVLVFSTLVYHAEHQETNTPFTSIPAAMWWALISLTT
jgi:potassium channel subfamily V protein 1